MNQAPEIIAEAGSNHNGDPTRAFELIDVAARSGASSVKFQFIFAEGLYVPAYFDGAGYVDNPVFDQRRGEELSDADWKAIWSHAYAQGMAVSASVFCERGLSLLSQLGAPYVKIASTDLINHALIGQACSAFERVIVSTGMAELAEIDDMVRFVRTDHPRTDLQLMHCVSAYPCPLPDANTQRVSLLRQGFELPVGYSDHTDGVVSAAMALVQGASFFEKHFTTDRNLPGFDHAHALDGPGLAAYVHVLRDAAASLARPANALAAGEKVTKVRARRGVYAAYDLPKGHVLRTEDLLFVRPSTASEGNGPSELVGRPLAHDTPRYAALAVGGSVEIVNAHWQEARAYWDREMREKGMQRLATSDGDGD